MANAKALSDEYESCEQCGEYVHRTTGMDKRVEINVSDTDHFRNWLFCSMDCLREWATENE